MDIYDEIEQETARQIQLRASGKFPWTLADERPSNAQRLAALAKEFGELAKEVTEELIKGEAQDNLRVELVQTAACCVAWLRALNRHGRKRCRTGV